MGNFIFLCNEKKKQGNRFAVFLRALEIFPRYHEEIRVIFVIKFRCSQNTDTLYLSKY